MKLSHRFRNKLFKNSAYRPVELDVCCIAWTSLQKGKRPSLQVCSCTSPTTKRPPPYYPVGSAVSAGTQVWSCYYASLPSARNTMIKLKVSDRRCAPFSRFNYVQLLSAPAPRCCTSGVGYCSSVKRLFSTSVSITHSSWWLNNLGIHPGLSHPPPPQKKKKTLESSFWRKCFCSFFPVWENRGRTDEVLLSDWGNKAQRDWGLHPLSQTLLSLSYLSSWMRLSKDQMMNMKKEHLVAKRLSDICILALYLLIRVYFGSYFRFSLSRSQRKVVH